MCLQRRLFGAAVQNCSWDLHHGHRLWAGHGVVNALAVATRFNQTVAQDAQLLGERGLVDVQRVLELANRAFALEIWQSNSSRSGLDGVLSNAQSDRPRRAIALCQWSGCRALESRALGRWSK